MSASPTAHRTSAAATTAAAAGPIIHISNYVFGAPSKAVHAGDRVTVINDDGFDHSYTSDTAGAFDTGDIPGGSSRTFVAPAASSTPYTVHCTFHSTMHGALTVS